MAKKILILAGSPRKGGNSDFLCDKFLEGAKEVGHNVEKIFISEKKIGYCRACYACRNTHKCFRGFADCFEGSIEKSVIYGHGLYEKTDARNSKFADDAYVMGKNV